MFFVIIWKLNLDVKKKMDEINKSFNKNKNKNKNDKRIEFIFRLNYRIKVRLLN